MRRILESQLQSRAFFVALCASALVGFQACTSIADSASKSQFEANYQKLVAVEETFVPPPPNEEANPSLYTYGIEQRLSEILGKCEPFLNRYGSGKPDNQEAQIALILDCFRKYGATWSGVEMMEDASHRDSRVRDRLIQAVAQQGFRTTSYYEYRKTPKEGLSY